MGIPQQMAVAGRKTTRCAAPCMADLHPELEGVNSVLGGRGMEEGTREASLRTS